jgi:hypothetical protein
MIEATKLMRQRNHELNQPPHVDWPRQSESGAEVADINQT